MADFKSVLQRNTLTVVKSDDPRADVFIYMGDGATYLGGFHTADAPAIAAAILDAAGLTVDDLVAHVKPDAVLVDLAGVTVTRDPKWPSDCYGVGGVGHTTYATAQENRDDARALLAIAALQDREAKVAGPNPQDVEALADALWRADGSPSIRTGYVTQARAILRSGEWQRVAKSDD